MYEMCWNLVRTIFYVSSHIYYKYKISQRASLVSVWSCSTKGPTNNKDEFIITKMHIIIIIIIIMGPTEPPIQLIPGALLLWVKLPGREADHSPPSSAEVKE
jgi:hypothetical protein